MQALLSRWIAWLGVLLVLLGTFALASVAAVFIPPMLQYEDRVFEFAIDATSRQEKFFHSRLYSSHYPLEIGKRATMAVVQAELDARGYHKTKQAPTQPGEYQVGGVTIVAYLRGFELPAISSPSGVIALTFKQGEIIDLQPDLDHSADSNFALEPLLLAELLGDPPRRGSYLPLSQIPPIVRDSIMISEDLRFNQHIGVDVRGILRAVTRNVQAGELKEGASTITQQLARTLFLTTERTYERKLSEVAIALLLDSYLPKDTLLELYLNTIYLGQHEGIAVHGVEEASRIYFSRSVKDLTLSEASLLAAIIPAPNAFSPLRHLDRALERKERVLATLYEVGRISREELEAARAEPQITPSSAVQPIRYGYFASYARRNLRESLGEGYEGRGLTIVSTLDPVLQQRVQNALTEGIEERSRLLGRTAEPLQGAALLMNPHSGEVLAVVGGRDYDGNPFNRAFQSYRQPGSAFKPIAYAAAIEGGEGIREFDPGSVVPDLRRVFQVKEGDWKPRNYEGDYHDTVTLAKALTKSLNVATVNLVEQVGPGQVVAFAEKLGIPNLKPVLSIGLGTNELTLEQLCVAFSCFSAEGRKVEPRTTIGVFDRTGRSVLESHPTDVWVMRPETAALMVEMLRNVTIYGTAASLRAQAWFLPPCAGKTGTSQDESDAWFIGFTPDLLLGIWVGFDTPSPLFGSASDIAIPVWGKVMTAATLGMKFKDFELPATLEYSWIDPFSGGLTNPFCPRGMRVAFLKNKTPKAFCTIHNAENSIDLELPPMPTSTPDPIGTP